MGAYKTETEAVVIVPKRQKVKVAVIGIHEGRPAILNLIRSELESRTGGDDLVGGELLPGEMPYDGAIREGREETDLELEHLTELGVHKGNKHVWAALGRGTISLSDEHKDYFWVPVDDYDETNVPDEYKDIILSPSGLLEIQGLAAIAVNEAFHAQLAGVPDLVPA